jgi:hypothetical protein
MIETSKFKSIYRGRFRSLQPWEANLTILGRMKDERSGLSVHMGSPLPLQRGRPVWARPPTGQMPLAKPNRSRFIPTKKLTSGKQVL